MSASHWPPKSEGTKHLRKQHLGFIIQDKIIWRGITRLLGESVVKCMAADSVSHFLQASCLILKGLAKQRWAECVWLSQVHFLLLWPWPYVSTSLRCWAYKNKSGTAGGQLKLSDSGEGPRTKEIPEKLYLWDCKCPPYMCFARASWPNGYFWSGSLL